MGASDVYATSSQINRALRASLTQVRATGLADNYNSLAEALHELNMWDFMFNQAEVIAQLHAFSNRDNKVIMTLTHGNK